MNSSSDVNAKIARYKNFLQEDPDNQSLAIDLIDLLCISNQLEDALKCVNNLADPIRNSIALEQKKAEILLGMRDFFLAKTYLTSIFQEDDTRADNAVLQHMLGLSNFFLGDYAASLAAFEIAEKFEVSIVHNWKFLAYSHHHLNHISEAIEACQQWVLLEPCADSYGYLGVILFDNHMQDAAREAAQAALLMDAGHSDAHMIIGSLALETQELALAASSFEQSITRNIQNGRAWLGRGLLQMLGMQVKDAQMNLEQAHKLMPQHIGTLTAIGWLNFKIEDMNGAKLAFEAAISLDRNFAESYGGLASVLIAQGNIQGGKDNMSLASKLDPANFAGNYAYTLLLRHEGKHAEADAIIDRLMKQGLPNSNFALAGYLQTFANTSQDK